MFAYFSRQNEKRRKTYYYVLFTISVHEMVYYIPRHGRQSPGKTTVSQTLSLSLCLNNVLPFAEYCRETEDKIVKQP